MEIIIKNQETLQSRKTFITPHCCTEVSTAPLIHFQKIIFKKGFYKSKLARELKFYTWIIIAGSKSLKKGQKMLKKARNLV